MSHEIRDIKPALPPGIDYVALLKGQLRLAADGTWWHEGKAFQNQRLAELFSRSIIWDESQQSYFLQIGRQRATFDLDDTAYFVTAINEDSNPWQIKLSDSSTETLDPATIMIGAEGQFYCLAKSAKHRARFSRSAHQSLLSHAIDEASININGRKITPKSAA